MNIEYAIIVRSKTRLEVLIEQFNTQAQAKFYIEHNGGNFAEYQMEHQRFSASLDYIQQRLSRVLKYKIIDRSYLPSYIFSENNLIIVVGQDGLVANTAKYAKDIPILAVNPDPGRHDGVLLPFVPNNFLGGVEQVLSGKFYSRKLHFAEAKMNDGQRLLAFNDLFIGAASHVSARYKIGYKNQQEEHSSSGIIVSTSVGATGWLSSIFNMANGVTVFFEQDLKLKKPQLLNDELLFVVREPFKSLKTQTGITIGKVDRQHPLSVESFMPQRGVIFSDGIESDFLNFNSGARVNIGIAPETATLITA